LGLLPALVLASRLGAQTNLVVAPDGSAPFKTVQEAIMAVPAGTRENPVLIHIKPGTYKELIYVQREKRFFHLLGEDALKTVLTFNLNANLPGPDGKPIGTFRTASTVIDADDFRAENITFENSAGPVGQALAVRVEGDRVVFRHCRFLGWQDTILDNRGRHYYRDCYVAGHVDFIFGGGTAFFDTSTASETAILPRRPHRITSRLDSSFRTAPLRAPRPMCAPISAGPGASTPAPSS